MHTWPLSSLILNIYLGTFALPFCSRVQLDGYQCWSFQIPPSASLSRANETTNLLFGIRLEQIIGFYFDVAKFQMQDQLHVDDLLSAALQNIAYHELLSLQNICK